MWISKDKYEQLVEKYRARDLQEILARLEQVDKGLRSLRTFVQRQFDRAPIDDSDDSAPAEEASPSEAYPIANGSLLGRG